MNVKFVKSWFFFGVLLLLLFNLPLVNASVSPVPVLTFMPTSTAVPSATRSVAEQVAMPENSMPGEQPKDIWDILNAASAIIGAVISGIFLLVVGFLINKKLSERQQAEIENQNKRDNEHKEHQLKAVQVQTIESFMPYLTDESQPEAKIAALKTIAALGNENLAISLTDIFEPEKRNLILCEIAQNLNLKGYLDLHPVFEKLSYLEDEAINRFFVDSLIGNPIYFQRQVIMALSKRIVYFNKRSVLENERKKNLLGTDIYVDETFVDRSIRAGQKPSKSLFANKQVVSLLISFLRDELDLVRSSAAHLLGYINDPDAIDDLVVTLQDDAVSVRVASVQALGEFYDERISDLLIPYLKDKDDDVKSQVVAVFGKYNNRKATATIRSLLKSKSPLVLANAIETLGKLKISEAQNDILKLLSHESAQVKLAALKALGEIGSDIEPGYVTPLLFDINEQIRWNAADLLGDFGNASAVEKLQRALLEDRNEVVRARSAKALGNIGDISAAASLSTAMLDEAEQVNINATIALWQLKAADIESAFLSLFRHKDARIRELVVKRSVLNPTESILETLKRIVFKKEDKDPMVRYQALLILGELGEADLLEPLKAILEDEVEHQFIRDTVPDIIHQIKSKHELVK